MKLRPTENLVDDNLLLKVYRKVYRMYIGNCLSDRNNCCTQEIKQHCICYDLIRTKITFACYFNH